MMSITSKKGKPMTMRRQERLFAYIFISPWIVGFLAFVTYPLLASMYLSLTDYDLLTAPRWIGMRNFGKLMGDRLFWKSLEVTGKYALMRVPAGIFFGLGLALILNRSYLLDISH